MSAVVVMSFEFDGSVVVVVVVVVRDWGVQCVSNDCLFAVMVAVRVAEVHYVSEMRWNDCNCSFHYNWMEPKTQLIWMLMRL